METNTTRSSPRTGNRAVELTETGEEGSRRMKCRLKSTLSAIKYVQSNAVMDLLNIQEYGHVVRKPKWHKQFGDKTLEETLRFIFLSSNVQLMAWGT